MGLNLSSIDSATSLMTQAYNTSTASQSTSMSRISSGKKFQSASDDIVDYMSLQNYQTAAAANTTIQTNLTAAGNDVTSMLSQANSIMDQLNKAQAAYASNSNDAGDQIVAGLADQLTAKSADGTQLFFGVGDFQGTGPAATVGGGGLSLDLSANGAANVKTAYTALNAGGADDLTKINSTATATAAIGDMKTYIGALTGLQENVTAQTNLAATAISNANALSSSVTQIDQAAELANVTDQNIQQQAAISMMSQANLSRQNIAMLYH